MHLPVRLPRLSSRPDRGLARGVIRDSPSPRSTAGILRDRFLRAARWVRLSTSAAYVKRVVRDKLIEHTQYITKYGQDMPEIRDWGWGISGRSEPRGYR
jgi:hypothetical protein